MGKLLSEYDLVTRDIAKALGVSTGRALAIERHALARARRACEALGLTLADLLLSSVSQIEQSDRRKGGK